MPTKRHCELSTPWPSFAALISSQLRRASFIWNRSEGWRAVSDEFRNWLDMGCQPTATRNRRVNEQQEPTDARAGCAVLLTYLTQSSWKIA